MIFLQGFIKFDRGISEKCVGQIFDGRKKERRRIIRIIKNGANTGFTPTRKLTEENKCLIYDGHTYRFNNTLKNGDKVYRYL